MYTEGKLKGELAKSVKADLDRETQLEMTGKTESCSLCKKNDIFKAKMPFVRQILKDPAREEIDPEDLETQKTFWINFIIKDWFIYKTK